MWPGMFGWWKNNQPQLTDKIKKCWGKATISFIRHSWLCIGPFVKLKCLYSSWQFDLSSIGIASNFNTIKIVTKQ